MLKNFKSCQLCGKTEKVKVYCGGPIAFMCDDCRDIVHKWEEAKEVRSKIINDMVREAGQRIFFKRIDLEEAEILKAGGQKDAADK